MKKEMAGPVREARVPAWKRALGWASVLISIGLGIAVGFLVMGGSDAASPEMGDEHVGCFVVAFSILGVVFLFLGTTIGALVYLSNGLTFSFDKDPVWLGFKRRIWFFNILVQTCLLVGAGFLVAIAVGPVLLTIGVQSTGAFLFPCLVTFVVLFAAGVPLNIWARLESRMVLRSLEAKGLGKPPDGDGVVGVSDGTKSAVRKFWAPQDDVGFLVLQAKELVFRGEKEELRVPRDDLKVGREGDAGNSAALFGISHVVLRYPSEAGERAVRLHPIGDFTMWGYRRTSDLLERQLKKWRSGDPESRGELDSRLP